MALTDAQAVIIGGVSMWELQGSQPLNWENGKATATRQFLCAWADRFDAMEALVGKWTRNLDGALVQTSFPDTFPGYGDRLEAQAVHVSGFGTIGQDSAGDVSYQYAQLDAEYRVREYDPGTDEEAEVLSTLQISYASEIIQLPGAGFTWVSSGKKVLDRQSMYRMLVVYQVTNNRLAAIPDQTLIDASNCVNSDDDVFGWGVGCVLFAGATTNKETLSDGTARFSATYRFVASDIGWNTVWHPQNEDWEAVTPNPYETYALKGILTAIE